MLNINYKMYTTNMLVIWKMKEDTRKLKNILLKQANHPKQLICLNILEITLVPFK